MSDLLAAPGSDDPADCRCRPSFREDRLVVEATDCPGDGRLAEYPDCRATVVTALEARDVDAVVTHADGAERAYEDAAAALLVAAGRFADRVAVHDADLASRARRDPLAAAAAAAGRAGAPARVAAESGLSAVAGRSDGYAAALRPFVGPTVARSRVAARPPPEAALADRRDLDTDATATVYEREARPLRTYHLRPVEATLDADALATLAAARDHLAGGDAGDGERAPGRAVRAVADPDDPVETLAAVLHKHTRGFGVFEDLFADGAVSDAFATAPVTDNRLRVTVGGEPMRTNVRLTADGAAALSSRLRLASGRSFSRASPTIDATATVAGRRVRVAGVTAPLSDGVGFALRAHGVAPFTLPALVANGTVPPQAAGLLSVVAERGAAALLAGPRGAGKTTLLGALLWELPAATRVVVIEDTPELPVAALQAAGRDVQALRTESATGESGPEVTPTAALRTALRLGEGALVVGEVRGEEARVLYEAMRVGASGGAVLGTVHGDGAEAVRERVVTDLGVPESSFATTDLVVCLSVETGNDGRRRRVTSVEEVAGGDGRVRYPPLFEADGDSLVASGRLERGDSRLAAALSGPDERYADVRQAVADRAVFLSDLAGDGRTGPEAVRDAHAARRAERSAGNGPTPGEEREAEEGPGAPEC